MAQKEGMRVLALWLAGYVVALPAALSVGLVWSLVARHGAGGLAFLLGGLGYLAALLPYLLPALLLPALVLRWLAHLAGHETLRAAVLWGAGVGFCAAGLLLSLAKAPPEAAALQAMRLALAGAAGGVAWRGTEIAILRVLHRAGPAPVTRSVSPARDAPDRGAGRRTPARADRCGR